MNVDPVNENKAEIPQTRMKSMPIFQNTITVPDGFLAPDYCRVFVKTSFMDSGGTRPKTDSSKGKRYAY